MSSPYWSQTSSTATAPTFSPASLASQIDSAIAAVQRDKRGALLISADLSKASAALLVKVGPADIVARVVKPYSGALQADISARVNFLIDHQAAVWCNAGPRHKLGDWGCSCPGSAGVKAARAIEAARALRLRDYYAILRHCGNSRFWSALKALAVQAGASVPLLPADTVP